MEGGSGGKREKVTVGNHCVREPMKKEDEMRQKVITIYLPIHLLPFCGTLIFTFSHHSFICLLLHLGVHYSPVIKHWRVSQKFFLHSILPIVF